MNATVESEPSAPCPVCGEIISIHEVYGKERCTGCGSSLIEMQNAASETHE